MGSERIHYHFYHFKGQLPLVTARNCDSLRVSANAVLFYNSGCSHPLRHALRSRVSVLRNRRLEVRILWGVLQLIKVVGTHSGGLFLFQFGRPKCNEIKGLAKSDPEFAVAPSRVR